MAPDRGSGQEPDGNPTERSPLRDRSNDVQAELDEAQHFQDTHSTEPQNFTFRGVAVGLLVGTLICFSNMYFGLQTGWISGMAMPSSLIGFAIFKIFSKYLAYPFTPVENVLIQTVAGALGTMPLAGGFVGVFPAMEYLLKKGEGEVRLGLGMLVVWALGLSFFGVVFAVPLRKEVIVREKLRFPSGTATALMIEVLHGTGHEKEGDIDNEGLRRREDRRGGRPFVATPPANVQENVVEGNEELEDGGITDEQYSWKEKVRLLVISFALSGIYTLVTYFIPQLRNVPFLGTTLANTWLWTLNPSPAYIGQGIIMGPVTTAHMLLGAILGWGVLSPLAKHRGWAPGPVDDWLHGSKGWIVWPSLAIMLVDSIVSLIWLAGRPLMKLALLYGEEFYARIRRNGFKSILSSHAPKSQSYEAVRPYSEDDDEIPPLSNSDQHNILKPIRTRSSTLYRQFSTTSTIPDPDAPPDQLIGPRTVAVGLLLSLCFCLITTHFTFPLLPPNLAILALFLALILSIVGVRALGETDLNPVSGISKITQLLFSLLPSAHAPHAVLINLLAGALSEAGAQQAGDIMQDLKTGHLLGASPKAQFWGQLIGSTVGAVVSACVYRLYTRVYEITGRLFQVPTAYVWVFTARLVLGQGLPPMVKEWALGAGVIWTVLSVIRVVGRARDWHWAQWVPGGIAVAVGMYNIPSFTVARFIGGAVNWWWLRWRRGDETRLIVLASGLVLGEGVVSIVNLALAAASTPHL